MGSHEAEASPSDAPGLSGPASDSDEALGTPLIDLELAEAQEGETLAQIGTREVGIPSMAPHDLDAGSGTPLREVDLRNGNKARALRQRAALSEPGTVEAADGSVHRLKAVSLVIPEEKRCEAMTVHGRRCRAGKMRGLTVCVFHSHQALTDDALATLADPEAKPRLTPRKALQAVVALRAGELAEAAVGGALSESGGAATRATLALIDAVDPLVASEEQITLSREGVDNASVRQLRMLVNPTG